MQKRLKNNKQPNAGQVWEITSQLYWLNKGWAWLLSKIKTRVVYRRKRHPLCFRTQIGDDGGSWINRITSRVCCTPYQWGQIKQSDRKSSSSDQSWAPKDTPILSNIREVNFLGTKRVYDLEVQGDESFLASGVFVHNSRINMQNLPSTGSIYAKPIKKCFKPPKDWLLVGADFNALTI